MVKVSSDKPNAAWKAVTQKALKALELATEDGAAVVDRLPDGHLDQLRADLERVGVLVPGALQLRAEAHTATAGQNAALKAGYALLSAGRNAVQRAGASAEARRAYGVGRKVDPKTVKSVLSGLLQLIGRARQHPAEARGFGILEADIEAMEQAVTSITAADTTQEEKQAKAPLGTRERNLTARRILAAVERIAGAGVMAFAGDAVKRRRYEALTAGPKRAPKKAPEP